jgi:hypothetical protein
MLSIEFLQESAPEGGVPSGIQSSQPQVPETCWAAGDREENWLQIRPPSGHSQPGASR